MTLNTFDWVGIGQDKNSSDMVGVDCSGFAWVGMDWNGMDHDGTC